MQMPGRHGFAAESGDWHGSYAFSIPPYLFVDHRAGNTPLEYLASQTIELSNGFLTGAGSDNYLAYIADSASMAALDSAYQLVGGGYRYGFNGQEHSTELNNDDYTAQFWEYDSRTGRRWNLDPKPTFGISEYSTFGNNPIFYTDSKGDTTYIYNQNAILKEVIPDNLTTNEIVFMRDEQIKNMMNVRRKYSDNVVATSARHKGNNIARITGTTIQGLLSNWTNSKIENGGVLYPSVLNDHQLNYTICEGCKIKETNYGGELNPVALADHSKETSNAGVSVIGYWHSHKENGVDATQPSSDAKQDLDIGLDVQELKNGGIGIIVNKNSITIFPLNAIDKNYQDVSQNNNKTKLFWQPYNDKDKKGNPRAGVKKYPSFNKNVTPVKQ